MDIAFLHTPRPRIDSYVIDTDAPHFGHCSPGKVFSLHEPDVFYVECLHTNSFQLQLLELHVDPLSISKSKVAVILQQLRVDPLVGSFRNGSNMLIKSLNYHEGYALVAVGRSIFVMEPYYSGILELEELPARLCDQIHTLVDAPQKTFYAVCTDATLHLDLDRPGSTSYFNRSDYGVPVDCPRLETDLCIRKEESQPDLMIYSDIHYVTWSGAPTSGNISTGVCVGNRQESHLAYYTPFPRFGLLLKNLQTNLESQLLLPRCLNGQSVRSILKSSDRYLMVRMRCPEYLVYVYDSVGNEGLGTVVDEVDSRLTFLSLPQ